MKQAIGYNETTGVMGGARPLDTYDLDLGLGESKPYTKTPFDITKINIKDIIGDTSQTKVLCKDGTFGYDISSSNAKYDNSKTCMNNGGRAENQTNFVKAIPIGQTDSPQKGKEDITKKLLGAYNQNLIIAVVLVAGYFAYKKFKK